MKINQIFSNENPRSQQYSRVYRVEDAGVVRYVREDYVDYGGDVASVHRFYEIKLEDVAVSKELDTFLKSGESFMKFSY